MAAASSNQTSLPFTFGECIRIIERDLTPQTPLHIEAFLKLKSLIFAFEDQTHSDFIQITLPAAIQRALRSCFSTLVCASYQPTFRDFILELHSLVYRNMEYRAIPVTSGTVPIKYVEILHNVIPNSVVNTPFAINNFQVSDSDDTVTFTPPRSPSSASGL